MFRPLGSYLFSNLIHFFSHLLLSPSVQEKFPSTPAILSDWKMWLIKCLTRGVWPSLLCVMLYLCFHIQVEMEFLVSPMYWIWHLVQKITYTQLDVLGLKFCERLYILFVFLFLMYANLTNCINEYLILFDCIRFSLTT